MKKKSPQEQILADLQSNFLLLRKFLLKIVFYFNFRTEICMKIFDKRSLENETDVFISTLLITFLREAA